jgi:hypothetical protein
MKLKRSTAVLGAVTLAFLATLIFTCNPSGPVVNPPVTKVDTIVPQPFPGTSVTGITFPTDPATITGWINANDSANIAQHAWGIWAGLTAPTNQKVGGVPLMVFETWAGIHELQVATKEGSLSQDLIIKVNRAPLQKPNQHSESIINNNPGFWVNVSYDPNAATYALQNKILKKATLDSIQGSGVDTIPAFPTQAITIKPVYYVGQTKDNLVRIPVWKEIPAIPDSNNLNHFVYADLGNTQPPNRVPTPADSTASPEAIKAATVNASDFINFKLDSTMAAFINAEQGAGTAVKGDVAFLVAMHVTSKEVPSWTWQTFYWAPDPSNPGTPSSPVYNSLMPGQVKGAARHYAVSTAYMMNFPSLPRTGGVPTAANKPVIGFNPYLESGFGPSTFNAPNTEYPNFIWGTQSNCMSCHALAAYNPAKTQDNQHFYSTDQYIDLNNSALFSGKLKTDFAWSIPDSYIDK